MERQHRTEEQQRRRVNQLVRQARANGGRMLVEIVVTDEHTVAFRPVEAVREAS
jgi:myo-inositol catabolism protein IolC